MHKSSMPRQAIAYILGGEDHIYNIVSQMDHIDGLM